mgnify:FL=1
MKVKEVLDYIREGEEVKLIISDGDADIIMYHKSCVMSDWGLETLISTIEIDDYCICLQSCIPDGHYLTLERQECEVSCCHD